MTTVNIGREKLARRILPSAGQLVHITCLTSGDFRWLVRALVAANVVEPSETAGAMRVREPVRFRRYLEVVKGATWWVVT